MRHLFFLPVLFLAAPLSGCINAGMQIRADSFEQRLTAGEYQNRVLLAYVSIGKGRACLGHLLLFIDGFCYAYNFTEGGFKPQLYPGTIAIEKYIKEQGRKIYLVELSMVKNEGKAVGERVSQLATTYQFHTSDAIAPMFYFNNCSTLISRDLSVIAKQYERSYFTRLFPYCYFKSLARQERNVVIKVYHHE